MLGSKLFSSLFKVGDDIKWPDTLWRYVSPPITERGYGDQTPLWSAWSGWDELRTKQQLSRLFFKHLTDVWEKSGQRYLMASERETKLVASSNICLAIILNLFTWEGPSKVSSFQVIFVLYRSSWKPADQLHQALKKWSSDLFSITDGCIQFCIFIWIKYLRHKWP